MIKKYQIFVSSTYTDLKKERLEIMKVVLRLNHIPIGMEMFNAEDEEQWKIIKRTIDLCDYYVLIIGLRYGSVDNKGKSFTEREYDYAKRRNIPVMSFLLDENAKVGANKIDLNREKIDAFRNKILENASMSDFWKKRGDLSSKVGTALINQISQKPGVGWIRGSESVIKDVERNSDLDDLCGEWYSYGYQGRSRKVYRGKIEVFFDKNFGYRVFTEPNKKNNNDDLQIFNGNLTKNGDQYVMKIYSKRMKETVVYSFMHSDIPIVKKGELVIVGVHLGFTHSRKSHAGIGLFSQKILSDEEILKILGNNLNFSIDENFKSGLYEFYDFDTPR